MVLTGKIKNWIDTKAELRTITAANPGADIGVYENMCIYQYTTPNDGITDDNENYIFLTDRSKGYWEKKLSFTSSTNNGLFKAPGNTAVYPEEGDWKLFVDTDKSFKKAKYKSAAWVVVESDDY